jgi:uncharacterized membrane-anchored protein
VLLLAQFRLRKYVPSSYWSVVVVISVFGTLITDNMTDARNVPLTTSTPIFAAILAVVFAIWFVVERTLSIHTIYTARREAFYWLAVLFTFALGTRPAIWWPRSSAWATVRPSPSGAARSRPSRLPYYALRLNAVLAFWAAYILTRPLGASTGDFMSQHSKKYGGLGLGTTGRATSSSAASSCWSRISR